MESLNLVTTIISLISGIMTIVGVSGFLQWKKANKQKAVIPETVTIEKQPTTNSSKLRNWPKTLTQVPATRNEEYYVPQSINMANGIQEGDEDYITEEDDERMEGTLLTGKTHCLSPIYVLW